MKERARRIILKSVEAQQYVVDKVKLGWTPEIIAGRIKLDETLSNLSHEAIYQYIYKESLSLMRPTGSGSLKIDMVCDIDWPEVQRRLRAVKSIGQCVIYL
jgi:IS30 family transposase